MPNALLGETALVCGPCQPTSVNPASASLRNERLLTGHKTRVFDLSWSPTQTAGLASVGQTGGLVWNDFDSPATTGPIKLAGSEVMRVCWDFDGAHVLTGNSEGRVDLFAANTGTALATLEVGGPDMDEVYGLQMLSREGLLAVGTGCQVQQWDLSRTTCIAQTTLDPVESGFVFGGRHRNPDSKAYVFNLAVRGRALCAALSDGTVRLLDSQTLQTIGILDAHVQNSAPVNDVAMSPTSPLLATADGRGMVCLWDLRKATGGPIAQVNHKSAVHSLAFVRNSDRPDGTSKELLVTGTADKNICVHVPRGGSLSPECTVSTLDAVLCVRAASSETTPRVATAGGSGGLISNASVSIWRLERPGQADADSEPHGEATDSLKRQRRSDDDGKGVQGKPFAAPVVTETSVAESSRELEPSCTSMVDASAGKPSAGKPSAGTPSAGNLGGTQAKAAAVEILVCQAGSCRRAGSEAVLLEIEALGSPFGCSARPEGCLGACDEAPNAIVVRDGEEHLHTRLDSLDRSASLVTSATGLSPNLEDPALRQRLTTARGVRRRQRARDECKWNAAMKGLADQIRATTDLEAQIELKQELGELMHSAGQWKVALNLMQQVMAVDEYQDPHVVMQVASLLGKTRKSADLDRLEEIVKQTFDAVDDEHLLAELSRHLDSCRAESAKPPLAETCREVEGYARWTLEAMHPVSRHSALFRFTSRDHLRGTPHLRGDVHDVHDVHVPQQRDVPQHRAWHTTLLAVVGRNEEGPLPWVERDYTPLSSWIDWEEGRCDLLVKIYSTGVATTWLRAQPIGSTVWLSQPRTTLHVPALVPDAGPRTPGVVEHDRVLLVLAGTGIVVAANLLQHADPATCFGAGNGRTPPLASPVSLLYACRHDDVLMTSQIGEWCTAKPGRARLQRCVITVSEPPTPFPTWGSEEWRRASGLHQLTTLANVEVVSGRLTHDRLKSELMLMQTLGRCRVVVSGPASFNGAMKEMLHLSGVPADAITILEA